MLRLESFDDISGVDACWLKAKHHFAIGPYGNKAHQAVGSLIVFNDDEIWARSGNSEDVCHSAASEILGGCGYLSGMPVDIRSKRRPRGKREQVRLHGPRSCPTRPKEIRESLPLALFP
jgi:hypothetical protein